MDEGVFTGALIGCLPLEGVGEVAYTVNKKNGRR